MNIVKDNAIEVARFFYKILDKVLAAQMQDKIIHGEDAKNILNDFWSEYEKQQPLSLEDNVVDGWISGEPKEAGWYMFAVRTNDKKEFYYILQMWFNKDARPKYWVGGGYVSDKSVPASNHFQDNVKFHKPLPQPPKK